MEKSAKQKKKERVLIIAIAAAVLISVTAYGMTIPSFTDYKPPDAFFIKWGDPFNAYPYRAIFFGGRAGRSMSEQKHDSYMWMVYSKSPLTDIFSFRYASDKGTTRNGYIRATYSKNIDPDEIKIYYTSWSGVQDGYVDINSVHNVIYPGSAASIYSDGNDYFFYFDFYYKCSGQHPDTTGMHTLGIKSLEINGVTSISNVPYPYILSCSTHGGGGTAESGIGGGSSGGSSSSKKLPNNTKGSKGRPAWGDDEDYGGGVNRDDIVSRDDGGGYSSRPDMELSVPDDWKKPVEDNYNSMPGEYKPDYPPYVPGEYDTGQTGADWELPNFSGNDGVTGEVKGYKDFNADGEQGYIEFKPGISDWGHIEFKAGGEYGLIDFMNP